MLSTGRRHHPVPTARRSPPARTESQPSERSPLSSEPAPPNEPRCHGPHLHRQPAHQPHHRARLTPPPSSESRLICYDNHIRDDESSEEPTTPAGKFRATGGSTLQAAQFVHEHPESAAAGVLTIPRLKFSAMLVVKSRPLLYPSQSIVSYIISMFVFMRWK